MTLLSPFAYTAGALVQNQKVASRVRICYFQPWRESDGIARPCRCRGRLGAKPPAGALEHHGHGLPRAGKNENKLRSMCACLNLFSSYGYGTEHNNSRLPEMLPAASTFRCAQLKPTFLAGALRILRMIHCNMACKWLFPENVTRRFFLTPLAVQVYIELALKALRTPSVSAKQRDSIEMVDGIHHHTDIRASSPESLLSRAELYVDQALTAGSGLPLARLVKGQALALRGKHQV